MEALSWRSEYAVFLLLREISLISDLILRYYASK